MTTAQRVKGVRLIDLLATAQDNPQFRVAMRMFEANAKKQHGYQRVTSLPIPAPKPGCGSLPATAGTVRTAAPAPQKAPEPVHASGDDLDLVHFLKSVFVSGNVIIPRYIVWANIGILLVCVGALVFHTRK